MRSDIDSGVSPVVGVMLMLVVTIVIAAVVSAFAGGLTGETSKSPQIALSGEYSQAGGLVFYNDGGDVLTTEYVSVRLRSSEQIANSANNHIFTIERQNISNVDGDSWHEKVLSFQPGDSAFVTAENMSGSVLQPQYWDYKESTRKYCFDNVSNIGKTITLELYDSLTGKIIAKSNLIIEP
ncbi:conserved hypothetical protein [Methanolacinia petrolearia DSM 11571]|uniref:Archaeal Type IV pilin N-terminal domain-containing protein n=1 Tax=Methanolacinia petrolearia (strain DSM 11571 / OCM 486 / SEBR 4847) TaxID=679926 RepID=E1RI19_METP4|nr:type IV pilin [Methanolacinia petrolearia]ADN35404.1 conserved hypothetical protein [Methanolacinia petrolearia DSM 11571]